MLIPFSLAPNIEGVLSLLQYERLLIWYIEEAKAGEYVYKEGDLVRLRNTRRDDLEWIVKSSVDCQNIVVC